VVVARAGLSSEQVVADLAPAPASFLGTCCDISSSIAARESDPAYASVPEAVLLRRGGTIPQ
jgi:hypothetical protein